MDQDNTIKTRVNHNCIICGSRGEPIYHNLHDRLFDTPGKWNLKRCPNPQCNLVWLDPIPLKDELGKLYENYFTHTAQNHSNLQINHGLLRFIRSGLEIVWNLFLIFTPIYWERKRLFLMYLGKEKPGKLLERWRL